MTRLVARDAGPSPVAAMLPRGAPARSGDRDAGDEGRVRRRRATASRCCAYSVWFKVSICAPVQNAISSAPQRTNSARFRASRMRKWNAPSASDSAPFSARCAAPSWKLPLLPAIDWNSNTRIAPLASARPFSESSVDQDRELIGGGDRHDHVERGAVNGEGAGGPRALGEGDPHMPSRAA